MKKLENPSTHRGSAESNLKQARPTNWMDGAWVISVLVCFVICGLAVGSEWMNSWAVNFASKNSLWLGLAGVMVMIGGYLAWTRGESVAYCVFLSLLILALPCVAWLQSKGMLESLKSFALWMTSSCATLVGQTNVLVDDRILFRYFTADQFSSLGRWNGVISYVGVGVFCVLLFRRCLLSASLTLCASVMVWPVLISMSYMTISFLPPETEMPTRSVWAFYIELAASLLGVAMIFSVDQFASALFRPIPFKSLGSKPPFLSVAWNWICGLPDPIYRATKETPSLSRHQSGSRTAMKSQSVWADLRWVKCEVFSLVSKPFLAICKLMDTASAWRNSREWRGLISGAPMSLTLVVVYSVLPFAISKRDDLQVLELERESITACSNHLLESVSLGIQEKSFVSAIGGVIAGTLAEQSDSISQSTKQYVELLSRGILSIDPKNQIARYRLGLVLYLNDAPESATLEIRQAASRDLSDFPKGDVWLAKDLVIAKAAGQNILESELQICLAKASRSPDCDFRLLFLYSSLLESKGELEKAVGIARLGVKARPGSILDLARLYARLGDNEGRLSTSEKASTYFTNQLESDDCEQNRLAIADARLLSDQPAGACEVLEDGIRKNICGDKSRRQLSEIQRMLYLGSIHKNKENEVDVDLRLLEVASDSDPTNPNISNEVAKLLAIKTKPTQKLINALQSQIESGIASATCHLILGEKYFGMGNHQDAKKHWELAVQKEPNNFTALNNLATCLAAISPSNVNRSIELVTMADFLSPNNSDILDTWGEVSMIANRPRDAVNKFELALKHDPKRIDIRKKLVVAYRAAGLENMAGTQLKLVQNLESRANAVND